MPIEVRDLSGKVVKTVNSVNNGGVAETAEYAFDCMMEEEDWVEKEIMQGLNFSHIEIDKGNDAGLVCDRAGNHLYNVVYVDPTTGQKSTRAAASAAVQAQAQQAAAPQPTNPNSNLPVKSSENFVGEFEVMDLSGLKGKSFIVAVNTGARDKPKLLCSTIHGPYDFYEMCDEVGQMWIENQHHAKVYVLEKDRKRRPQLLDETSIDYIEANFKDIITEGLLDGAFDDVKNYTCQAGLVEARDEDKAR